MNIENTTLSQPELMAMEDGALVAQYLVQQGAIHAVSFMLANACSVETAAQMLVSLRTNAKRVREETERRGKTVVFDQDQTAITYM